MDFDVVYADRIAQRRADILQRLADAAAASGRTVDDLTLCAVSKTVDLPEVCAAYLAGYRHFAENRPQELMRKQTGLGTADMPELTWHMIGNLQTNKINAVLACRPRLIHSIASLDLARAVSERCVRQQLVQDVLLEVNVSGEASKSGMTPAEILGVFDTCRELEGIRIKGLMTMAPRNDEACAARVFEQLRLLRDDLASSSGASELTELSMGMSEDFEAAVREGATIVRLGRVVFDPSFPFARRGQFA